MRKFKTVFMRGGTSKGCMFHKEDLPEDRKEWDNIFLQCMGDPDPKQIDGLGGTVSSNNKIVIVWKSEEPGVDVEYLVGQVIVGKSQVDYKSNCGNMTAAVGPYAVEEGMVDIVEPITTVRMLNRKPHTDSYEQTVEKTAFLVRDAIRRQIISDVPVCTFLSGGVDSSLVSAVCSAELKKKNKQLTTFSFDFKDNHKYFTANAFQPSMDRPFVDIMVKYLGSDHHYLECDNVTQADLLYTSVEARDLPAMADVDSSLLYFCSQVSRTHKVALTGECADEIFGGYPWFHKKECFEAKTFPWTMDLSARKVLLSDDFIRELHMDEYVQATYEKSVAETPRLAEDTPEEARRREIAWLNLRWFMQTLLDRMDRTSMHSGLEARVPFADHRIVEYLWNVPWYMKTRDGVAKHLLRESGKGLLPDEVLWRRKSPYPKTYDRAYEALLVGRVREILEDNTSPVLQFLDKVKTEKFLESPSDYGKPWYGQLMAGPQMLAYMIQVDYWLKKYNIEIV